MEVRHAQEMVKENKACSGGRRSQDPSHRQYDSDGFSTLNAKELAGVEDGNANQGRGYFAENLNQ